jgi:enoyl-CoA hydratase
MMSMADDLPDPDVLLIERDGDIAVLRMNRPDSLNAANHDLHSRLARVWTELAEDESLSCVVLTGTGRAFSAGGDLDVLDRMNRDPDFRRATLDDTKRLVRSMVGFPLPIIAAVNGPAVGLGCSLAGMCDIVLIEESAYFADPHVAVGLVAGDGGALTWPALTSLLSAKEYLFTGDRISAHDAVRLGLANRVVNDGAVLEEATVLARRIAAQPTEALRATKRLVNAALERAVAGSLDFAVAAESVSSGSAEHGAIVARMLQAETERRAKRAKS